MSSQSALKKADPGPSIDIPEAFLPLIEKRSRWFAYYGGRGSAKSHSFAIALVLRAAQGKSRVLCCREIQNSIRDSVKQLIEDKITQLGLAHLFSSTLTEIVGKNGSRFTFAGLRTNADSIKSMEGLDIAWVEEANCISQRSLDLLVPTLRKDGSELWFSWNPESEFDAVDALFRGKFPPPDAVIRRVSYKDNPWFPDELKKAKAYDERVDAAKAAHVWGGEYKAAPAGSYYGGLLAQAANDGRIGRVPHDSGAEVHACFDLGNGPHQVVWFAQWVGREIRLIDYLQGDEEAADEGLAWFARQLRAKPYTYAPIVFPHDARARLGTGHSRVEYMEGLKFKVEVLPLLPVQDGIEAVKRILPMTWIDAGKCVDGLKHIRAYRDDWDEKLRRSNGPFKDGSNHAADALRYMAMAYEAPRSGKKPSPGGQVSWQN